MTEFESHQGALYTGVWAAVVLCVVVAVLASGDQVR